jgi:hypothetical protein
MILPSFHLIVKQWRSSLSRAIVVINQRQLATTKQQENEGLVHVQNNQISTVTFSQKGRNSYAKHFPFYYNSSS